jgi:kinesin family protein C2/C3
LSFLRLDEAGDKLDVKEGPEGMFVAGLRSEPVGSFDEVVAVLQKGKQSRSTFATNMNEHSSRSHLVLSLYVVAKNLATGAHRQ